MTLENATYQAVSMTRFVLAVAGAVVAITIAGIAIVYFFDVELPNSSGTVTTLGSIVVGVGWFAKALDRPMLHSERIWFAAGVTLINLLLPIAYAAIVLSMTGLPITLEGADLLLGGGKGALQSSAFSILILFTLGLVFIEAYVFAWLLTRKLPRRSMPG